MKMLYDDTISHIIFSGQDATHCIANRISNHEDCLYVTESAFNGSCFTALLLTWFVLGVVTAEVKCRMRVRYRFFVSKEMVIETKNGKMPAAYFSMLMLMRRGWF